MWRKLNNMIAEGQGRVESIMPRKKVPIPFMRCWGDQMVKSHALGSGQIIGRSALPHWYWYFRYPVPVVSSHEIGPNLSIATTNLLCSMCPLTSIARTLFCRRKEAGNNQRKQAATRRLGGFKNLGDYRGNSTGSTCLNRTSGRIFVSHTTRSKVPCATFTHST